MFKKFIGLTTALVMLLAVSVTARAEEFSGGDGWSVTFDGSQMTSTFKNTDIDDAVYQLQPGDTVTIHLKLANAYSANTDWYMTNEVLQSLEDSQTVAEGGAYSYILKYVNPKGESNLLYSSDDVGGESINESGEGLRQATDSLEDYFYLDTLAAGEEGEITLVVKLEGETQGNTYQDTLAKLQMNFAVELTSTATGTHTPGGNTPGNKIIKTGDNSKVLMYSLLALLAGLICAGLAFYKINQSRIANKSAGSAENDKSSVNKPRSRKRRGNHHGRGPR